MAIIGIIGSEEAEEKIVIDGLISLRSLAEENGDTFWAIVGLTPDSPEVMGAIITWFIDEGIAYDLVVHPDVAGDVPEDFTNGADKMNKIKAVDNKVVDRLIAEEGTHLLVLLGPGDDVQPSDELTAVCQKAFDNGLVVMDLADALSEFSFAEPDVEGEEEGAEESADEPDYDALGEAADGGDAGAQEVLEDLARAVDIDPDEIATYAELAAMLKPAEEKKPAAKKAAGKPKEAAKKSAASTWTQEALDALEPKEVKAIAAASGIDGVGKMALSAVKAALIGKPMPAADEPEPEEEKPAPKKPAARGKGKAPSVGEPLAGAPDTGDVELNDILALVNQAFTRLVNYIAAK